MKPSIVRQREIEILFVLLGMGAANDLFVWIKGISSFINNSDLIETIVRKIALNMIESGLNRQLVGHMIDLLHGKMDKSNPNKKTAMINLQKLCNHFGPVEELLIPLIGSMCCKRDGAFKTEAQLLKSLIGDTRFSIQSLSLFVNSIPSDRTGRLRSFIITNLATSENIAELLQLAISKSKSVNNKHNVENCIRFVRALVAKGIPDQAFKLLVENSVGQDVVSQKIKSILSQTEITDTRAALLIGQLSDSNGLGEISFELLLRRGPDSHVLALLLHMLSEAEDLFAPARLMLAYEDLFTVHSFLIENLDNYYAQDVLSCAIRNCSEAERHRIFQLLKDKCSDQSSYIGRKAREILDSAALAFTTDSFLRGLLDSMDAAQTFRVIAFKPRRGRKPNPYRNRPRHRRS